MIKVKRVYEKPSRSDGARFLIDRLWPRGIKKTEMQLKAWIKEIAPSHELRRWFAHDPDKWPEFQKRYAAELDNDADALQPLVDAARRGTVTLLYAAHDPDHNNAVALANYLGRKIR